MTFYMVSVFFPDNTGRSCKGDQPSQGKQEKGSHLGGGHVTKETLGEIDVGVAQMWIPSGVIARGKLGNPRSLAWKILH